MREGPEGSAERRKRMKHSRRFSELATKVRGNGPYDLSKALELLKESASAKFDETVEVVYRLGIDPRKSDQQIRGTIVLPHGTGRSVKVLVLAKGEKVKEAEDAGADFVGGEDYIAKIQEGWLGADTIIATPDMMKDVGKLGKILGPRGLMPNPKTGTVTFDVAKAVGDAKAGKVEYRTDKTANVHVGVGKASFEVEQLRDNLVELTREILRVKPAAAKGVYIKKVSICTTMGPGIGLDLGSLTEAARL
jgi:large subunit ribosomal protein L1